MCLVLPFITDAEEAALACLIGEYDDRGQVGYELTERFFTWFEGTLPDLTIEGPRSAGRDIELSSLFPRFEGSYPCDFAIRNRDGDVLAVGFARYDSTRGGAQSDDRTSGNYAKVLSAMDFSERTGAEFRILFVADGPGLVHPDTWAAACKLDGSWHGNVRVVTLKLCDQRVTRAWLVGA